MKQNVGKIDRIVRFTIGTAIVVAGMVLHSWWGLLGIIPILTAVVGWCPAYVPFGISSCARQARN